jgi:hypothetical protein
VIRRLDLFWFNISVRKSQLFPTQKIRYCGLLISSADESFDVGHTHLWYIEKLLFSRHRTLPSVLGYISYWLYAVHLTAAVRRLVASRPDVLNSGPWPLPRPPEHLLATDASEEWLAAVDGRGFPMFIQPAPVAHIYHLEMLALFMAVILAPPHSAIGVDNQAVIGSLRRSQYASRLVVWLSWLCAMKDIVTFYIPTDCNPAKTYTRELACCYTPVHLHAVTIYFICRSGYL